jgi:hypothetical protein
MASQLPAEDDPVEISGNKSFLRTFRHLPAAYLFHNRTKIASESEPNNDLSQFRQRKVREPIIASAEQTVMMRSSPCTSIQTIE